MIKVFVGYDPREAIAFHVCVNSIIRTSSDVVAVSPLALNNLRAYTEKHADGSNTFIYSRFLVPFYTNYEGWAIFIDGDMILREDIAKLWALRDEEKAVMCVQHDYKTKAKTKYLGAPNENYPRKNWSSVVLWNCSHPANAVVTPEFVAGATGAQLHRFSWLKDELIGSLPIEWNWLPDEFGENKDANLLHFTLGTPCFVEFAKSPMASDWHREKILTTFCMQTDPDSSA